MSENKMSFSFESPFSEICEEKYRDVLMQRLEKESTKRWDEVTEGGEGGHWEKQCVAVCEGVAGVGA